MKITKKSRLYYGDGGRYRFVLTKNFYIQISTFTDPSPLEGLRFTDEFGKEWARITDKGVLIISKGYAWDGCSPAFKIKGRWYGTPSPEETRCASLVHDVLYQFLKDENACWTRKDADHIFKDILIKDDFDYDAIYYGAVRAFGGMFVLL